MKSILIFDKVLLHNTRQEVIRGAELFNISLSKDLANLGFQETIVAATSWKKNLKALLPETNITYKFLPPFRVGWINALLSGIMLMNRRFDYVFLTNVGDAVILPTLFLHKRKAFSKVLIIAHRTASAKFLKALNGVPATVIAVNNLIAKQFREGGFSDVYTDYGIVDADDLYPDPNPKTKLETKFVVFGSLDSEWKGADMAINAFLKLPQEVQDNSSLHLAGYSRKVPTSVSNRIKFYPWISKKEVPAFLRSFDVMLVPSRDTDQMKETFSQTTVQGMLSGLPIIASNIPVLAEKLNEGGGLIFNNESELTEQMGTLYHDHALRQKMGIQARATAKKRYVWSTSDFVKKYLSNS